nr:MAG TPA: Immunity protein Imm2 [Caudoviricetes sp.]
MYKVKITLNNGYYYVKTMTENEVEEFKNDLRYIGLIELWENENNEVIIFKDAVNSIEIKKLEENN